MRVTVVPYDETWPASFGRVAARLAFALSDLDVHAIEHVGSTSVPGLASKPVFDMGKSPLLGEILERAGLDERERAEILGHNTPR